MFSFFGYGFSKFKSEQKFYDDELNKDLKGAFVSFDNLDINKNLETKLLKGLTKSKGNDYYSNRFNELLFRYYYFTGDIEKCYALFVKEVTRTDIESRLSYVSLLAEFYDAFNQISYEEYTDQILNRMRFIGDSLDGDEKKWVEFYLLLKQSLSYKNSILYVNRDDLQKSTLMLDEFSDTLSQEEYLSIKTKSYNYLAINYMELIRGNIKEVDVNNIDYAISLFKKSLRFNEGRSKLSTFIVYNNLAYVFNVKGDYDESLDYLFKAKELLTNADSSVRLKVKLYCNLTDSYSLKFDKENLLKYYPTCLNELDKVKKIDEGLLNLINQNKIKIIPEVKLVKPNEIRVKILLVFAFISVVSFLYWFNRKAKY